MQANEVKNKKKKPQKQPHVCVPEQTIILVFRLGNE